MDELAAAAAVVAMATGANAPGDLGQRGDSVTVDVNDAAMPDVETTSEDKENSDGRAAAGGAEDAPCKVSIATSRLTHTPCSQHLT